MGDIVYTTARDWEMAVGQVFGCMDYAREHGPLKTMQKIHAEQEAFIAHVARVNKETRLNLQLVGEAALPKGWKIVPIMPTEEMIEALVSTPWIVECSTKLVDNKAITTNVEYRDQRYVIDGWEAMLKAAPSPFATPEQEPA